MRQKLGSKCRQIIIINHPILEYCLPSSNYSKLEINTTFYEIKKPFTKNPSIYYRQNKTQLTRTKNHIHKINPIEFHQAFNVNQQVQFHKKQQITHLTSLCFKEKDKALVSQLKKHAFILCIDQLNLSKILTCKTMRHHKV